MVIETGFARGGSAILYSSILQLIGEGRVVSIDIDVREHNRRAVEEHPFGDRVDFVEGSSTAPDTMDRVRALIPDGARVMVVLDSNHTHQHVLDELRLYGPLVTEGQFLVVSDTVVEDIPPRPIGRANGARATTRRRRWRSISARPIASSPTPGSTARCSITSSRGGYLRCVAP